jgi:hypothetical protein
LLICICTFCILHYALSLCIIFASLYFAFANLHLRILHCALSLCIIFVHYLYALSLSEKQEKILFIYFYLKSWWVESRIQVNTRYQRRDSIQILNINIVTRFQYSISKFWLESSLDELRIRLDLDDSIRRDQSIFILLELFSFHFINFTLSY